MRKLSVLFVLALLARPALGDIPSNINSTSDNSVEQKGPAKKVRFYGLGLDYSLYYGSGLNGINYNGSFDQYFQPSWSFGQLWLKGSHFASMNLSARFVLTRAVAGYDESQFSAGSDQGLPKTCSDLTPSDNGGVIDPTQVNRCKYAHDYRWDYSDVWLTLAVPGVYTVPVLGITLSPSIRGVIPASLQSRFHTMRFSLTPSLALSRSFWHDRISLGYSFAFTKYFHKYTTAGFKNGEPLEDGSISNGLSVGNVELANWLLDPSRSGAIRGYNPNYSFLHVFSLGIAPVKKLSISVLYILSNTFAYAAQCMSNYNGEVTDLCANGDVVAANSGTGISRVGKRDAQGFWLAVGYQALDWLNVSASMVTYSPLRHPDNTPRQPFISFDYNAFTMVSFGATVTLEKLAEKAF